RWPDDGSRGAAVGGDARVTASWRRAAHSRPRPRSAASALVQRADRLLALPADLGLLVGVLLGPELDRPVLRIHEHRVALLVLAGEDLLRERIEDQLLDRAADRPRPVDRVVALLRDERLR